MGLTSLNLLRKLHLVIRGPPELRNHCVNKQHDAPPAAKALSAKAQEQAIQSNKTTTNATTSPPVSQSVNLSASTNCEREGDNVADIHTRFFNINRKANTRTHKHTKQRERDKHKEMKAFRSTSGVSAGPPPPPSSSHKRSMHSQVLQHNHQHKITTMTQQREAPRSPSTPLSPMDEAGHFSIQLEDIIKNKSYRACYLKFLESSRCTGMCVFFCNPRFFCRSRQALRQAVAVRLCVDSF